uniref:SFRICE_040555 n=1 Tax=Spodoptera frugiperda TaxID=7108 RepID=A0A2H1VBQ9_SPOFR
MDRTHSPENRRPLGQKGFLMETASWEAQRKTSIQRWIDDLRSRRLHMTFTQQGLYRNNTRPVAVVGGCIHVQLSARRVMCSVVCAGRAVRASGVGVGRARSASPRTRL